MNDKLTYRDSGVDIDTGNQAVARIKKILSGSTRKVPGGEEVGAIGSFAGAFRPFLTGYLDPLLVASTDGVGTKLLIALKHQKLENIGQDLVAMCVNDLVVCGARPLFFLDYIATAKLEPEQIEVIVSSINKACVESECLLIGGECAEMPGMYAPGHTDLAGFAIGVVESEKVKDGSAVKPGDIILGLASNGLHSNGYSLVRKIIEREGWKPDEILPGCDEPLLDILLKPTRLYVKPLLNLFESLDNSIRACAHITGGGLIENIPRSVNDECTVVLRRDSWPEPEIFRKLKDAAVLDDTEMDRTFNRGIGMAVIVDPEQVDNAVGTLEKTGEKVCKIGLITARTPHAPEIIVE